METPYSPPESGLAAAGATVPSPGRDSFGTFEFGRVFELAWQGLSRNFGPAVGLYMLLFLLIGGSLFLCCPGWFFALPHLVVGATLMGYYLVRGELRTEHLFSGFRNYWRVLLLSIIVALVSSAIYFVVGGPYHYRLLGLLSGLDWTAGTPGEKIAEQITRSMQSGSVRASSLFLYVASAAGYYLAGRWLLCTALVVERGYGVMESLGTSWRVTRPYHGWLLLVVFLSGLIAVMGLLVCGVGVFVSYPLGMAIQGAAIAQLLGDVPATASSDSTRATEPARVAEVKEEARFPTPRSTDVARDEPGRAGSTDERREDNPYG